MIRLLLFTTLTSSLFFLTRSALERRTCLSYLTQYRVEKELSDQVKKSYSLRKIKLNASHLLECSSPIFNRDRQTSRNLLGQKIKLMIGGKLEDN